MGRQFKEGLDYFAMNCQLDDGIKLIQAEFGLKGFAVVVKLLQKIYGGHGYYCEWNDDLLLLFMSENGVDGDSKNLIEEIVRACIKRQLFSSDIYERYGILTSPRIQEQYLNAVSRRGNVKLEKACLLIDVDKKYISADIKPISVDINPINADKKPQRKEEKRKEEKKKSEKESSEKIRKTTAVQIIDGKGFAPELSEAVKDWIRYKIERHEGYRETGLNSLLVQIEKNAREYGAAAVTELIRRCMANNWQGIQWDRLIRQRGKTQNYTQRSIDYDAMINGGGFR